jgi:hypothetical protein
MISFALSNGARPANSMVICLRLHAILKQLAECGGSQSDDQWDFSHFANPPEEKHAAECTSIESTANAQTLLISASFFD